MDQIVSPTDELKKPFNPLKIIIPVLLSLLLISLMAQWYASNVSLPRYCKNPQQTLQHLGKLIEDNASIDNTQRRSYMVAAKLLFLHPRQNSEGKQQYLERLRYFMLSECQ